ncbi:hypothetical protein BpHYR1_054334 [Brachionus plicatilis]|uniref:Uncharacterized protein n=1 Tax=Brachionus plicatilis TaxID=10195 RepID=A0A3M7S4C7_BRAPC|nr:hypothetical protein BpHYR1_054334 [Brachionus plicatilis]
MSQDFNFILILFNIEYQKKKLILKIFTNKLIDFDVFIRQKLLIKTYGYRPFPRPILVIFLAESLFSTLKARPGTMIKSKAVSSAFSKLDTSLN